MNSCCFKDKRYDAHARMAATVSELPRFRVSDTVTENYRVFVIFKQRKWRFDPVRSLLSPDEIFDGISLAVDANTNALNSAKTYYSLEMNYTSEKLELNEIFEIAAGEFYVQYKVNAVTYSRILNLMNQLVFVCNMKIVNLSTAMYRFVYRACMYTIPMPCISSKNEWCAVELFAWILMQYGFINYQVHPSYLTQKELLLLCVQGNMPNKQIKRKITDDMSNTLRTYYKSIYNIYPEEEPPLDKETCLALYIYHYAADSSSSPPSLPA